MEPSIRSFSAGQINVLVDGMRIHGACTDKMDPATIYIEPINLESLEVQTAGNGIMQGSAIGGSINMKIAEPDYLHNNRITGIVSSGYQTAAKSFYESVRLNYSKDKLAIRLSGTYRHHKNYRSGGGKTIDFSQFEKLNYSLSVKYLQSQYNYIKADLLMDEGWNLGYPALPMDVGYAGAKIGSLSFHHENRQQRLYKYQLKIYANQIRHFMDDTKRPDVPIHMDMPGISKTYGAYAEGDLKINHHQQLSFKVDAASTFLKASMTMYQNGQLPMYMLTWPDNKKDQLGISSSWLLNIDSTMKLQVTGRLDYMHSYLSTPEAKDQVSIFGYYNAGRNDVLKNLSSQISKKISGRIKLSTSLSYSERSPTASELYGFYLFNSNDSYDYIGNPDIKIEKALQADISANYNWGSNRIQVTTYFSKVLDFISNTINNNLSVMTIGAKGVKSYINIPEASIMGVEASCFLKPVTAVDIISTIRLTSGRDNKKDPLPSIAPFKNITAVRYQPKKVFYQFEYEFAGNQNRVNAFTGEDRTESYFLMHTRFGYHTKLLNNFIEMQAGVENIFDIQYHEHLDWGNISRPGRNMYIQLKVSF